MQQQFAASPLVQAKIGVTGVCEPCASLAGGELIVGKTLINGVTIAVAKNVHNDSAHETHGRHEKRENRFWEIYTSFLR